MVLKQIDGPVVLEVSSDPRSLFLVRCMVERLTERMEFTREEIDRMVLAVDEACTNIIRHAYHNRPGERLIITFNVRADELEILIRDFGDQGDPQGFKSRDLCDVRPGGLGIHFIHSAMDEVRYETPADGGTLLRMVKYRSARESATKACPPPPGFIHQEGGG